jgi:hypothetical protein
MLNYIRIILFVKKISKISWLAAQKQALLRDQIELASHWIKRFVDRKDI